MKLVKIIELPNFKENSGDIVFIEELSEIAPFTFRRIFYVKAQKGSIRGKHAHRKCSQLLICTNGAVEVLCDNYKESGTYILDKPNIGLLISPKVWAEQKYLKDDSILTVICDQFYEEEDYMRNYSEFSQYVNAK